MAPTRTKPPERSAAEKAADTAARMRSLLLRWRQSLDLHARYLTLDDAHYWHVQPWPAHERPAAWIVNLARQKIGELTRLLDERLESGDEGFAAGIEHMVFLANLVGLQPAGRYIPLADAHSEIPGVAPPLAVEATREMPRPRLARAPRPNRVVRAPIAPSTLPAPAAVAKPGTAAAAAGAGAGAAPAESPPDSAAQAVIEDAVRLLQWGRSWHELGELISRLSGRPSVGDIRRVLRTHRLHIESVAGTHT